MNKNGFENILNKSEFLTDVSITPKDIVETISSMKARLLGGVLFLNTPGSDFGALQETDGPLENQLTALFSEYVHGEIFRLEDSQDFHEHFKEIHELLDVFKGELLNNIIHSKNVFIAQELQRRNIDHKLGLNETIAKLGFHPSVSNYVSAHFYFKKPFDCEFVLLKTSKFKIPKNHSFQDIGNDTYYSYEGGEPKESDFLLFLLKNLSFSDYIHGSGKLLFSQRKETLSLSYVGKNRIKRRKTKEYESQQSEETRELLIFLDSLCENQGIDIDGKHLLEEFLKDKKGSLFIEYHINNSFTDDIDEYEDIDNYSYTNSDLDEIANFTEKFSSNDYSNPNDMFGEITEFLFGLRDREQLAGLEFSISNNHIQ